ncbi:MAG: glutamate--tRNA ligase [Candidatus Pacebacteria bacterium]|nr:glutamate--tRNA ligase [Candidatus Paceibacterota bacterium]
MNKEITEKIITRLPPSPTGLFHIGTARTALFNYLFTKQNNGKMLFRMEDTDKERSKKEFEDNITEGLNWLGIDYDGEITRQSERTDIYKKYLNKMIEDGFVYEAEESKEGDKKVIRFKNPNKEIVFQDLIRGEVKFDTSELGDFVIAKSLEEPLYHLTVVIDDFEGEVSHVIRGEDGISNTPRQILIQEAIGAERPVYAHLPLILAQDKSKMSKRFGAVSIDEYKNKGYLQDAIINYLALLGWSPQGEEEIFTLNELIEKFDIKKVHKGGAIFNIEKLNWINKEHIKLMSDDDFKIKVLEFIPEDIKNKIEENPELFNKILPIIKERIEKFEDIIEMTKEGDLNYYFEQPEYELEKVLWKDDNDLMVLKTRIEKSIELIESVGEFSAEKIKEAIWDYASDEGRGSVLWPIRYALSGKDKSPDPFILCEVLGKEEVIKRLNYVIEKIQKS